MGRGEEISYIFPIPKLKELGASQKKDTRLKERITSEPDFSKRPLFDHNSCDEMEDKATLEAPYSS